MRKSAVIIISIVSIFAIFLGYNYFSNSNNSEKVDALKFKEEYEKFNNKINSSNNMKYLNVKISKKNVIKYSSYDEVFEILKSGSGVIYFGSPEDPTSRSLVPILLEASEEIELDTIYYLDISKDRDLLMLDDNGKVITESKGTKNYFKLVEMLKDILNDYVLVSTNGTELNTGNKRIDLPLVLFVSEGKIVVHHFGTLSTHENPYLELNDKEYEEVLLKMINYMGIVSGIICDESC